jgi:hypothetical protein
MVYKLNSYKDKVMSGKQNGIQVCFRQRHQITFHIQCTAHSVNLVISEVCSIMSTRNCMTTVSITF